MSGKKNKENNDKRKMGKGKHNHQRKTIYRIKQNETISLEVVEKYEPNENTSTNKNQWKSTWRRIARNEGKNSMLKQPRKLNQREQDKNYEKERSEGKKSRQKVKQEREAVKKQECYRISKNGNGYGGNTRGRETR